MLLKIKKRALLLFILISFLILFSFYLLFSVSYYEQTEQKNDIKTKIKTVLGHSSKNSKCATRFFKRLFDNLVHYNVSVFVIETSDILRAASPTPDFMARFIDDDVPLNRYGVLGEDAERLEDVIHSTVSTKDLRSCRMPKPPVARYQKEDGILVNAFVIVATDSNNLNNILDSRNSPYYLWKRVHFRLYHKRGRSGYEYRWTGREDDDDGNVYLPAEAFDDFRLEPASAAEALFLKPADADLFVWQRGAAEFKTCVKKTPEGASHPKLQQLVDNKDILFYMKPISMFRRLMADFRVRSFLNCATLLGWWRQCSIVPKDIDIDLMHWSNLPLYPAIMKAIKAHPDIDVSVAYVDYWPFQKVKRKQEWYYVNGYTNGLMFDLVFAYKGRIYHTEHRPGGVPTLNYADNLCSADLHGHLVYVPCSDSKIREIMEAEYGKDPLDPDSYKKKKVKDSLPNLN